MTRMCVAIRYDTQTGNTKKLAEALAAALHAGHPNEAELDAAKAFTRRVVE